MKLTKKQFSKLIKEVTDEAINEYETVTLEEYRVFFVDTKTNQSLTYKMRVEDKWSLDRQIKSFIEWQKEQGKELSLDPTKSPQYIRRIKMNDEGGVYEGMAKNYPSRPMEEAKGNKWWNVSLDRPGAGWTELVQANNEEEAKKIANKKHKGEGEADTVWETKPPQKNFPGSDTDKWKSISGAEPKKPVNNDIKQFAQSIADKIKERRMKKGSSDLGIDEAVRQMIEFKLAKEGWIRRGVELTDKPSADGATYNITPA